MKTLSSKPVTRCQISNSNKLESLIFLGYLPPVNTLKKVGSIPNEEISFPAELLYCKKSKLAQLGCIVDKEILFPFSYPYTSSTTKILRDNFKQLALEVVKNFSINTEDLIIDIGSNDGNLLLNFKKHCKVLGVTPENIAKIAIKKGIPTIQDYFSKQLASKIINKHGKAKIITATNVFAHIDNVSELLFSIKKLMRKDSIFISESHYLYNLIKENQYDTVYHEHLRYYSLHSLKYLFNKYGLEIIKAKKINTHGGSIRVYAAFKGAYKKSKNLKSFFEKEKNIFQKDIYSYSKKILKTKLNLYKILNRIKSDNNKIYGISAPSRATTLVNYIGLKKDTIDCILEIEGSKKINYFLPGTDIPIYNEKKLYQDKPEYVIIFSWHIAKEIINNLKLRGYKGKFIVPLPRPKIIC